MEHVIAGLVFLICGVVLYRDERRRYRRRQELERSLEEFKSSLSDELDGLEREVKLLNKVKKGQCL